MLVRHVTVGHLSLLVFILTGFTLSVQLHYCVSAVQISRRCWLRAEKLICHYCPPPPSSVSSPLYLVLWQKSRLVLFWAMVRQHGKGGGGGGGGRISLARTIAHTCEAGAAQCCPRVAGGWTGTAKQKIPSAPREADRHLHSTISTSFPTMWKSEGCTLRMDPVLT